MNPTQLKRDTELESPEELGLDQTRKVARQIADAVQDPKMHPSIPMKVARAITRRQISASELVDICDYIVAKRVAGELRSPGAYFVVSIKRVFQAAGVPWK